MRRRSLHHAKVRVLQTRDSAIQSIGKYIRHSQLPKDDTLFAKVDDRREHLGSGGAQRHFSVSLELHFDILAAHDGHGEIISRRATVSWEELLLSMMIHDLDTW